MSHHKLRRFTGALIILLLGGLTAVTPVAAAPHLNLAAQSTPGPSSAGAAHTVRLPLVLNAGSSQSSQPPANDPIIFFQGDLVAYNSVPEAQRVVALLNNLIAQHPNTPVLIASPGDNEQEHSPTISDYQTYFGGTYGPFFTQGIFRPVRGNHDAASANNGQAFWDYFGSQVPNNGGMTNYSYDLGGWHIIAMDQVSETAVTAKTLSFLKGDLAANADSKCQIAYWHVPIYSSGPSAGDSTALKPLSQALYDAGVDIQINGHDHHYQRFYPLNPNGARDNARGITTFITGIGGQGHRSGSARSIAQPASARFLDSFPGGSAIGTVMFTLHPDSADYTLYNAYDGAVLDQGTVTCH
jgi:hypothetical protein